jgi:RimJ/RimL family protein N-acetyltransferase
MWHELQLWMSWSYDGQQSLDATRAYIQDSLEKQKGSVLLGFLKDGGDFVVSTGAERCDSGDYATGYWVAKPHQGNGFATEATNAVVRYAFGAMGAAAVTINYYEGNDKSAGIIRKLGFTPTHTVPKGHNRCLDGTPLDVHHFRMTDVNALPPLAVSWS